jgi:anti-sigma regulatory factor (Ser/Thr protein kinase)
MTTGVPHSSSQRPVGLVAESATPRPFEYATALAADHAAIGPIRHDLVNVLQRSGLGHLADAFAYGATELMANAVLHGCRRIHDGTITVSVRCDGQRIRLKVQDPSAEQPRVRDVADDETSGRGMLIVQAFADRWGVEAPSEGAGKAVWMEMACTPSSGWEGAWA